jgi:hypothetical protein
MKTLFLAFLLFCNHSLFSQGAIKISVTGIDPNVEQKLLDNDVIPEAFGLNNITLRLRNADQKNWTLSSSNIYKVIYDPSTRHYTMNINWDVKPSQWYSLTKPVVIRIVAYTKFYNAIWTEVTRSPQELTQPIVLNQYTASEESNSPAVKGFLVTGKDFPPHITTKFLPGDAVLEKSNNVLIRIKNQGETQWAQENSFSSAAANGRIWLKVPLGDKVDVTKPVVLQVGLKTKFGNYVWGEKIKNVENFHERDILFQEYSGKIGEATATLKRAEAGQQTKEDKEVNAITASYKEPQPTAMKGLVLTQHGGIIQVANPPDSLVKANLKSTLLQSTTITVGLQQINIKGSKPIEYNPGLGYVLTAWSDGDQQIRTDHGSIKIKDATPLSFSKYRVTGAMLSEHAILNTEYGQLTFGPGLTSELDIRFDEGGRLQEGTLAAGMKLNAGTASIDLPIGSRVKFRNKKLSEVFLSKPVLLSLSNLTYTIKATSSEPSIWIDEKKGIIDAFIAGENNSLIIEGTTITMKEGTKVTLDYKDGAYSIRRFYLKEPKTLKEYGKKGKVKEVQAKEGKRITVEEGKITDIN